MRNLNTSDGLGSFTPKLTPNKASKIQKELVARYGLPNLEAHADSQSSILIAANIVTPLDNFIRANKTSLNSPKTNDNIPPQKKTNKTVENSPVFSKNYAYRESKNMMFQTPLISQQSNFFNMKEQVDSPKALPVPPKVPNHV